MVTTSKAGNHEALTFGYFDGQRICGSKLSLFKYHLISSHLIMGFEWGDRMSFFRRSSMVSVLHFKVRKWYISLICRLP